MRACGIATPPPVPVDPNSSRLRISAEICSGAKSRALAARRASSCNKRVLWDARRSTCASAGARNFLMSIAGAAERQPSLQLMLWRAQTIADAGFRQHILRALGIGFDLLSQLSHIDAQVLRIGEIVPQLAEQEFMGQHLARMLHQHAQEV